MLRNHRRRVLCCLLLIVFAMAGVAPAQNVVPEKLRRAPIPPQREREPGDENAEQTRQRLEQILQQYPPSLAQVLRLDPSLLSSEDYLSLYPMLSNFLGVHPEIA